MLDLAQAVREQIVKETPPRKGEKPKTFTFARLRRAALWGMVAAGALLLAVFTGRSEVGAQRIALMLHPNRPLNAVHAFDAEAETQRLANAVRSLETDDNLLRARVAAVERDVSDVTGSINKEIEAADAARSAASMAGPTVSSIATATLSIAPVTLPDDGLAPAPLRPAGEAMPRLASPPTAYAVDIGSGLTIEALRARWLAIYTAHPQLFEGMRPIVSIREVAHGTKVELRLLAGPLEKPGAATELCASLTQAGLYCQPTVYDGQRLALR
jgi:hypothetical protein